MTRARSETDGVLAWRHSSSPHAQSPTAATIAPRTNRLSMTVPHDKSDVRGAARASRAFRASDEADRRNLIRLLFTEDGPPNDVPRQEEQSHVVRHRELRALRVLDGGDLEPEPQLARLSFDGSPEDPVGTESAVRPGRAERQVASFLGVQCDREEFPDEIDIVHGIVLLYAVSVRRTPIRACALCDQLDALQMMKRETHGLDRDRIGPQVRQRLLLAVLRRREVGEERAERIVVLQKRGSSIAGTGRGGECHGVPRVAESGELEAAVDDELLRRHFEPLTAARADDRGPDAIFQSFDVFQEEVDAFVAVQASHLNRPRETVTFQNLDRHAPSVRPFRYRFVMADRKSTRL